MCVIINERRQQGLNKTQSNPDVQGGNEEDKVQEKKDNT